jgi:BioD-like phosphotransacetylase family protein
MKRGYSVGYCKPVGQKFLDIANLRVDKDTILFADLIHFDIVPELHSPVILGNGATTQFLDNPDLADFEQDILSAEKILSSKNELVIYEGTGHPGVGSVANLSNARVAKLLNAGIVMIVEGGIGSTIDMLNMCTALFREENVPILGVIINKVRPDKLEKVKHYVGKWLAKYHIPLLGVLPYDKTLAYPLISTIEKAVGGTIIFNAEKQDNKIESILAGSLIDLKELTSSQDLLLVVATRSLDSAIQKIRAMCAMNNIDSCPLSGIVATGGGNIDGHSLTYIEENELPLIRTNLDTYGSVIKISKIEVKINTHTPWKIRKAIDLIENNVDLNKLIESVRL